MVEVSYATGARTVTCRGARTQAVLTTRELPPSAWGDVIVAGGGQWWAVANGMSVLVYPCREPSPPGP